MGKPGVGFLGLRCVESGSLTGALLVGVGDQGNVGLVVTGKSVCQARLFFHLGFSPLRVGGAKVLKQVEQQGSHPNFLPEVGLAYEVNEGGLPAPSSQPLLKGMKKVSVPSSLVAPVRTGQPQSGPNIGQLKKARPWGCDLCGIEPPHRDALARHWIYEL